MSSADRSRTDDRASHAAYSGTDNLEVLLEATVYANFLRRLICRYCPKDASLAIDFGAGIGTFSGTLNTQNCRVLCVEPDVRHQTVLRENGFEIADLDQIKGNSVDYAFTLNVLEHIEDDQAVLRSIYRVLKPGGSLFVYVPAFQALWSSMDDKVGHLRRYTRGSLRAILLASGFDVQHCRYADSAGFLATLAFKALGSADGSLNPTALRLFDRIAFPVGRIFDRIGASLLIGKNVYCHARKRHPDLSSDEAAI